jgi:formylglycine-generating enzyme required for sulfatase activity
MILLQRRLIMNQPFRFTLVGLLLALPPAALAQDKPAPKTASDTVPTTTVPLELVQLPAGKLTLKDKDGKETTYQIKPLWMSKTEITWDHYYPFSESRDLTPDQVAKKFDAENRPSRPYAVPHGEWGPEGYPANRIHELAAKKFCAWLSKKTGKKYRLPTEAEWEYACRAGGAPYAPPRDLLKEVAWYVSNSQDHVHAVAKKKPNAWGFYDMFGNVGEWVTGPDGLCVVKGGSYQDEAGDVNSSARQPYNPDWQRDDAYDPKGKAWLSNGAHIGFRVVRED